MDLAKLSDKFPENDIEWRVGESGTKGNGGIWARCFAYLTNRAVQNRLDEVCGPDCWMVDYKEVDGGFLAGIGILCKREDGGREWVWKWDGAERTDFEALKGGISGSMKRAAVQWGIGRYLYDLDVGYADVREERTPGYEWAKTKSGEQFFWKPPALPGWALPGGFSPEQPRTAPPKESYPVNRESAPVQGNAPAKSQPKTFDRQVCPNCGLSDTTYKSKKEGEGFYCWKKKESKAMPGQFGCGFQWIDEISEPFSGGKASVSEMSQAHRANQKSDDIDPVKSWGTFFIDASDENKQAAIRTLVVKKFKNKEFDHEQILNVMIAALNGCKEHQLPHVEAQIDPLFKEVGMPQDLWGKIGEVLPDVEERLKNENQPAF